MRRLIAQSWTRPVPPSSLIGSDWLPESSRSALTKGAAVSASSIDSWPSPWPTWMTCTSLTPGSASRRSRYSPRSRRSTSWSVSMRQRRCCATMASVSWLLVRRKEETPGGTVAAIAAINSSSITPGPFGMAETRPSAAAPWRIARRASSTLPMQQIFTRGRITGSTAVFAASLVTAMPAVVADPGGLWRHAAPVDEQVGDGLRRGQQLADADVLVGAVGAVDVASAVHHAGHSAEADQEAHVGAVGYALDGGRPAGHPLVRPRDRAADRRVGRHLGRGELAAEPLEPRRV